MIVSRILQWLLYWEYINVCGYNDQFCKISHTTYIHTTYRNEWSQSLSEHVQARQKKKDQKKIYSLVEVFVGRSEKKTLPKKEGKESGETNAYSTPARPKNQTKNLLCARKEAVIAHHSCCFDKPFSGYWEARAIAPSPSVMVKHTFRFLWPASRSHMTQYHCGYCKLEYLWGYSATTACMILLSQ